MTVEAVASSESDLLCAELIEAKRRLMAGDAEDALATLAPLIGDPKMDLSARFLLGMAAWKIGRLDWSLALLRECHEARPMDGVIAEILASLYAQAGNLQESLFMGKLATALKAKGRLAELVPPEFPSFDWAFQNIVEKPKLTAAERDLAAGRYQSAVENARQHAALNPQDDQAQAFYARQLLRVGSASKAVEVLRFIETAENFAPAHASLYARALAAVGEFDAARRWHDEGIALASNDAEILAARVADSVWLEEDAARVATIRAAWVQRFCPPKPSRRTPPQQKLTFGYIVSAFADPLDAAHIAAVARAHDRQRVMVIGYGIGAQSWDQNLPFQGAFDLWQDITALEPAELAMFFERDGLDVVIDAAGFAAPGTILAFAELQTALRVAWIGNQTAAVEPVYDVQLVSSANMQKAASLWRVGGGYPVLRAPAEPRHKGTERAIQFGTDVGMAQIDGETLRLWSTVLMQQPDAMLLLRAHDMAPGANIDRLITAFGRDLAARIDVVSDETPEAFYDRVDVALTPRKGVSPRMAAEALACGVPPVAIGGVGLGKVYASFLEGLNLGSTLVASDGEDYARRAIRLATSPEARKEVLATLSASPWASQDGVARFARALEDHAQRALTIAKAS